MGAVPAALASMNTLLKLGDGLTVEGFETIANVSNIQGPTLSGNVVDVTSHSTAVPWRQKIVTLLDAGEISFDLFFIPSDTDHAALLATIFGGRELRNYQLVFPDTDETTWQLAGYISSFSQASPVDGVQTASVTITLTGEPDFSVS